MKTSEEMLSRMERLMRRMAITYSSHPHENAYDEARAIVAELDALNGPKTDEEWADKLSDDWVESNMTVMEFTRNCIAKGRELERANYKAVSTELFENGNRSLYIRLDEGPFGRETLRSHD